MTFTWELVIIFICGVICLALFIYQVVALQLIKHQYKSSLQNRAQVTQMEPYEQVKNRFFRLCITHLQLLLSVVKYPIRINQFLSITFILFIIGLILGRLYFTELSSIMLCALLFMSLPYLLIRSYLVHKRIEAQRKFLPAIELFYQYYLITGGRQIKLALARAIEEQGIISTMHYNFTQLHRNLTLYPDIEYSLAIFTHSTGHRWANYFSQLLLVALNEGVSIKGGLKSLINDMRKARKLNEVQRHRLLEIRIANFTPFLFLAFFIAINFSVNYESSIKAYFYDEVGRKMLLYCFVLITLSFMMGIHLSRKRMG